MPPELVQWIPPAVIVGVMLYLHRVTRQDMKQGEARLGEDMKGLASRLESRMDRMETRLREDMAQLRNDMSQDMERLDGRVARLEHGQAKLEGLLEGLREAITHRNVA